MGIESWIQIHESKGDWYNPKKKDRLLIEVASGYAVPLIISFLTLIVEFSSPRCAMYKPRFGEETCFFSGTESKVIWFFLPLGILLLINLLLFVFIVYNMFKLENKENMSNTKKMKKFCQYLKLFIGLGLIWSLEIIGGVLSQDSINESAWYFADVLNILQGVYIFVIFVCKKDVLTVILNKEVGSYSLESTKDDSINSEFTLENVEMDSVNYDRRQEEATILNVPGTNLVATHSVGFSHSNGTRS